MMTPLQQATQPRDTSKMRRIEPAERLSVPASSMPTPLGDWQNPSQAGLMPKQFILDTDAARQFHRVGVEQVRVFQFQKSADTGAGAQGGSVAIAVSAYSNQPPALTATTVGGQAGTPSGQPQSFGQVAAQGVSNNKLDPSTPAAILAKGSIPPTGAPGFSYTSTTTSITWSWTGLTIYRADGTTTNVPNGSQAITGLTANTTYNFYPFWSEVTHTLQWVSGGSGSPGFAFTGETATQILQHSQAQALQQYVPLTGGPIAASTPSSGSGGGSGGGTKYCIHEDMWVTTKHGNIRAKDVKCGDWLACPDTEWTQVRSMQVAEQHIWIRIQTQNSGVLIVTPSHHITLANKHGKAAESLGLQDLIQVRGGVDAIQSLSVLRLDARKVKIWCEPEHRFYAGQDEPMVVAHNFQPVS